MAFFDDIVAASGLSTMLAPFTMTRLLVKEDIAPGRVTPADLSRALPAIRAGLAVYLTTEELEKTMRDLERLAGGTTPLREAS